MLDPPRGGPGDLHKHTRRESTAVTVVAASTTPVARGGAASSVADSLLRRHAEAEARLQEKRDEQHRAEMRQVKAKPSINAKSRALAQRRGGGAHIAERGAAALAAKQDKAARMREALAQREEAELQDAPRINPTSRRLAKKTGGVNRMLAWQEARDAKLAAKRRQAEVQAAAALKPTVTVSRQSKRILAMRGAKDQATDAASRLYALGVKKQQERADSPERKVARGPRSRSAAKERTSSAPRGAIERQQHTSRVLSAPRPRRGVSRSSSPDSRLPRRQSGQAAGIRARLFPGRSASAPRGRAASKADSSVGGAKQTDPRAAIAGARPYTFGGGSRRASAPAQETELPSREEKAPSSAPAHGVALTGGWFQYVDKTTGQPYFFHQASNTVTWTRPSPSSAMSPAAADSVWVKEAGGQFASRFAQVAASLAQA